MATLQVGNVGSILRFTVVDQDAAVVNVSAATLTLYFRSPQNKVLTKSGALTGSGTDGIIQYTTIAGDLDTPGNWLAQAKVVISGSTWFSNIVPVQVQANLS